MLAIFSQYNYKAIEVTNNVNIRYYLNTGCNGFTFLTNLKNLSCRAQ